jgi:hypothetical protein
MTIAEGTLIEILFVAFTAGIVYMKLNAVEKSCKDHEDRLRQIEKRK